MKRADQSIPRRMFLAWLGIVPIPQMVFAKDAPLGRIAPQPYFAGLKRAISGLERLGAPIASAELRRLLELSKQPDDRAVEAAEAIVSRYVLAHIVLAPDGSADITAGAAPPILVEQGWRMFLFRIVNQSGRRDLVALTSSLFPGPGFSSLPGMSQHAWMLDQLSQAPKLAEAWLMTNMYEEQPIILHAHYGREVSAIQLSGAPLEYGILQAFSRDSGPKSGRLTYYIFPEGRNYFEAGHHAYRFDCRASKAITLAIKDADGRGCTASLTIRDSQGRVYPAQGMRLAPDLFFQPQIYRADGETVSLPDGEYSIESTRGPEYLVDIRPLQVGVTSSPHFNVTLKRWIDPAKWDWYSGDPHVHAAGCAHYQTPTEGVAPETMIRQARGEGLAIAEILTWGGGGYDYQKQFFTGHAVSPLATLEHPELQAAYNVHWQPRSTPHDADTSLRYDVEVSGFPSSHAGHLILLGLRDQNYPGTARIEDWPSWNLPILQWARRQGAVCGYAHCGNGMVVESNDLPNFEIPPMNGVGTQEAIVDVTHGAVDFLAGLDTQPVAELNAWYHMMNCDFRLALVGETDYPCLSDERIGMGRSYARLEEAPIGDQGYAAWIEAIARGRSYCSDGRSHFLDFKVNRRLSGTGDFRVQKGELIHVDALVAAFLNPAPPSKSDMEAIEHRRSNGWHLEKARIGESRDVPVELVVNGKVVEQRTLRADGQPRALTFSARIERSSWVALRVLPSAHTHPVFVEVAGKPIRASRQSAQWCRACVDKVWDVKSPFMRDSERSAARAAFDHAAWQYDKIIGECEVA